MGEIEEFNPLTFEKRLTQLKDTQESIQSLSSWCLKQRDHHKKIVQSWLNVLKRVKVEQRLVLFYLANDVIQYSKRKNYEFVESWGLNLQKATPLVRDEKVRHKILRIFKIWEQRSVYDEEFLSDLTGLLSAGATKKTDDDPLDFQPQQLVNKIKQCTVLEADTDLRLKYIHESHLQLSDADALCANLKDRSNKDDVEKELNEGIQCVEKYTQALQREIVAREALLALLATANQYYSTQRGEVKVVAYAYKNFGARVRALKRKLDELADTLPPPAPAPAPAPRSPAPPSPPRRDEDVPSPGPDEDLDLPNATDTDDHDDISYNIDQTFNSSMSADGSLYNLGLSSFLTSDNPMALFNDSDTSANNTNKIEVINSRPNEKQDFDINNFLKTLVPNDHNTTNSDSNSGSVTIQPADPSLPGLDLLVENTNPPPPTSFYGSINDDSDAYHPEMNSHQQSWNNNSWSIPPAPVPPPIMPIPPPPVPVPIPNIPLSTLPVSSLPSMPLSPAPVPVPAPRAVFADTPESPPPAPAPRPAPVVPVYTHNTPDMPSADVDHRGLLPPPPPPPVLPLLGNIEDVDHRMLPLPPPPPPVSTPGGLGRHSTGQQDVDHRNLISLTHQPLTRPTDPRTVPSVDQVSARNPLTRLTDPRMAPSLDQVRARNDYRVPPMVAPNDVVEIVDMDLSEDEDQQGMYPSEHRRNSFNNNKVLVGGDNGKTNHNLVQINRELSTPPGLAPLSNPFDNMPVGLKNFNMPPFKDDFPLFPPQNEEENSNDRNQSVLVQINQEQSTPPDMALFFNQFENMPAGLKNFNMPLYDEGFPQYPLRDDDENSNDSAYEDDLRSRGIEQPPAPPERENFQEFEQRPFNNQRFPRNWGPRNNFRPPFGGPPMRPWNGPRPPPNRWMGPRQRFW